MLKREQQQNVNRPYPQFSLTLVVNHACNLRCSYCYTGAKFNRPMPLRMGPTAIDRAFQSIEPGGALNLGFFGGEPLLEAESILEWMDYARSFAANSKKHVNFSLTTNGTILSAAAWHVMFAEDLDLAVSFDGTPSMHDRHRRTNQNQPTAATVEHTVRQLLEHKKPFTTIVVVRPDTLREIPEAIEYLHALGVRGVNLSLDLWTRWMPEDGQILNHVVTRLAEKWFRWLPDFSLNWFDTKAGELAHLPQTEQCVRCGFGAGEIAVAPSGRLYPCERLVGEDRADQPLRLPGDIHDGTDFLGSSAEPFSRCSACSECALNFACDTFCRCSNFIRTGDVNRPDGLLCLLNKATARATVEILSRDQLTDLEDPNKRKEKCYA
jgi:uncharacterized protein